MADVVQGKKDITFIWHDDEHKAHAMMSMPKEIVENFFHGQTLEFTFQREYGRIDVRQRSKRIPMILKPPQ